MHNKSKLDKAKIIQAGIEHLIQKKQNLMTAMRDLDESLLSESKSSAGDKHETARAKMHSEQAHLSEQVKVNKAQLINLEKLNPDVQYSTCIQGALVFCDKGVFFISEALGKIKVHEMQVFFISMQSPLAKCMFNRKVGEKFQFNAESYLIQKIT